MVGAKMATGGARGFLGDGLASELGHGLIERLIPRYGEHDARSRAGRLARITWTEEARHEQSDPGRDSRDPGSTPLRGVRLT